MVRICFKLRLNFRVFRSSSRLHTFIQYWWHLHLKATLKCPSDAITTPHCHTFKYYENIPLPVRYLSARLPQTKVVLVKYTLNRNSVNKIYGFIWSKKDCYFRISKKLFSLLNFIPELSEINQKSHLYLSFLLPDLKAFLLRLLHIFVIWHHPFAKMWYPLHKQKKMRHLEMKYIYGRANTIFNSYSMKEIYMNPRYAKQSKRKRIRAFRPRERRDTRSAYYSKPHFYVWWKDMWKLRWRYHPPSCLSYGEKMRTDVIISTPKTRIIFGSHRTSLLDSATVLTINKRQGKVI